MPFSMVQEIAVVGDNDHGAAEVHEPGLQPLDAAEVQVVRGLVQEDDVGLLQKKLTEEDTGLLAAGEVVHALAGLLLGESQAVQDPVHPGAGLIAVGSLVGVLGPLIFAVEGVEIFAGGVLHGFLQLREAGLHVEDGLNDLGQLLPDGEGGVDVVVLVQVADAAVFFEGDDAGVRREFPGDEVQKRRLAGAVQADDGGLVMFVQKKRGVPDDRTPRKCFGKM